MESTSALVDDTAQVSSNNARVSDNNNGEFFEDTSSSSSNSRTTAQQSGQPAQSLTTVDDNITNSNTINITNISSSTFQSPWPYSSSKSLPLFARPPSLTYLSYDKYYFQQEMKFCSDCRGISKSTKGISAAEVANRLWKVCNNILEQFEKMNEV